MRFSIRLWCAVPAVLALAGALHRPAAAQKVQDQQLWGTFHKTPALNLKTQYATYSLDYDFGNLVLRVNNRPALQGLPFQKAGGDLLLRITVKNLYVASRRINERNADKYTGNYSLGYSVDCGYELRDVKSEQVLASYHKTGGTATTPTFTSRRDLDAYVANAFVGEHTQRLLEEMVLRVDFALNPHDYPAGLLVHAVTGPAPAYADINKATDELRTLLAASPNAAPDRARVQALAATWQQHLARANWDDKKSEINKKVANALIENLCAAATLTEDYAKLKEYAAQFNDKNKGFFSHPLSFQTPVGYGGTAYQADAGFGSLLMRRDDGPAKLDVYYEDLAADVAPAR